MLFSLGNGVEGVGIGAKINESGLAIGILPWDNEDRVLGGTFDGPLGKHNLIISGCARASDVGKDKAEKRGFGPVSVVSPAPVGLCEEGAVATVLSLQQGDVRVGFEGGKCLGRDVDKRIVERVQDQSWDGDAIHNAPGCDTKVVVLRGKEARVERRDTVVELAQGADAGGAVGIERARKEPYLATKALEQVTQEALLVETVLRLMQGSRRQIEINGRGHADH